MTQRTLAGLLAVPLLARAVVAAALRPLPYVTYEPGLTVDVLARDPRRGDHPGRRRAEDLPRRRPAADDHRLRLPARRPGEPVRADARLDQPRGRVGLPLRRGLPPGRDHRAEPAARAPSRWCPRRTPRSRSRSTSWVRREARRSRCSRRRRRARRRRAAGPRHLPRGGRRQGHLGPRRHAGRPDGAGRAAGHLRRPPRPGSGWTCRVTPRSTDGKQTIGIQLGTGYAFPFDVSVNIDPSIGGPSAGLMFSLGIYDTLTPGSLTGGATVAGTGTIDGRRPGRADRRHPAEDRRRPQRRRRALPGAAGQLRRRGRARRTATCAWSRPPPCTPPCSRSRPGSRTTTRSCRPAKGTRDRPRRRVRAPS